MTSGTEPGTSWFPGRSIGNGVLLLEMLYSHGKTAEHCPLTLKPPAIRGRIANQTIREAAIRDHQQSFGHRGESLENGWKLGLPPSKITEGFRPSDVGLEKMFQRIRRALPLHLGSRNNGGFSSILTRQAVSCLSGCFSKQQHLGFIVSQRNVPLGRPETAG